MQTKLHHWAREDPACRFDDLYNLVYDRAFLTLAWERVRKNTGARSSGVDGQTAYEIEQGGVEAFLDRLRADLKARTFRPLPVRERMIPKPGGKSQRRLGIPTVRDRVVQAALKLVLEPIFEADFQPVSYGFRPNRRTHDAIAEVQHFTTRSYEWVVDADVEACFDRISHVVLMDRVRARVGDKRVLALVKAFLKAGILSEGAGLRASHTGTPQGGILSPLLANVALSVLDDHFVEAWHAQMGDRVTRARRRRHGLPMYRLVRYADDFVLLVSGQRSDADALRDEAADVLAPLGLNLSAEKTRVVHIDDGFDFLGYRVERHTRKGSSQRYVYTYPSKAALGRIKDRVREATAGRTHVSFEALLHQLNRVLRGWTAYFRYGVSSRTFSYLSHFVWWRVVRWLRRKHGRVSWKRLRRQHLGGGWWPVCGEVRLFEPMKVRSVRYRYRGARIPSPWVDENGGGSG